jgi:ubiquinone biosynthesis accessory factor UbiJ
MLTATLENVLNRGLPRSPRARQLCAELAGRKVAIEVPGVVRMLIESTGSVLRVARSDAAADAEITGGLLGLLALAGDSPDAVLQRRGVDMRGDTEVAGRFREIARLLQPDLEEELSLVVGDVPAHQLGNMARAASNWGRQAIGTTVRNVFEYLAHESGDLVSRNEGEQFLRGVDALREDVDRLEARLNLLTRA